MSEVMRAIELHRFGAPDEALRLNEAFPMPTLRNRDLLVRVVASSVNPIDCARRAGYGRKILGMRGGATLPLVLGRDVSGVVEAVGPEVTRFRAGDEIWAGADVFRNGCWAEYVALDEEQAAAKPTQLSHEEAASIPYVALTTWAALVGGAGLDPAGAAGKRILVHAGAGGVGSFAIQLLVAWGAHVATTCSTRNVGLVKRLGAHEVIDYTQQDYADVLRDYDMVYDTLGFEAEAPSLSVLKQNAGAQYASIVHPLMPLTDRYGLPVGALVAGATFARRKLTQRLRYGRGYHWSLFSPNGAALEQIGKLAEEGRIHAVIDRVLPLEEIAAANEHVESRRAQGKVVLSLAPGGQSNPSEVAP